MRNGAQTARIVRRHNRPCASAHDTSPLETGRESATKFEHSQLLRALSQMKMDHRSLRCGTDEASNVASARGLFFARFVYFKS